VQETDLKVNFASYCYNTKENYWIILRRKRNFDGTTLDAELAKYKLRHILLPACAEARKKSSVKPKPHPYFLCNSRAEGEKLKSDRENELDAAFQHFIETPFTTEKEGDMSEVEKEAYANLRSILLTQDGCGSELNALLDFLGDEVNGNEYLRKFIAVKHHAQATGMWQPHDVAKCHGLFRKAVLDSNNWICEGQEESLPEGHVDLWLWLYDECGLPLPLARSLFKHCVNMETFVAASFTKKVMVKGYVDSGVRNPNFMDFLMRCHVFFKGIKLADAIHLENKIDEIIAVVEAAGEINPPEILNIIGVEWALQLEETELHELARKALMEGRLAFTPSQECAVSRKGTVVLTRDHQKKLREETRLTSEQRNIHKAELARLKALNVKQQEIDCKI